VIGRGTYGENIGFGLEQLPNTDIVMIRDYSFFLIDDSIQGIYCITTGEYNNFYGKY